MKLRPEGDYLASLAGMRVALVGSAASAAGTGLGAEVDGHDLVVRVNWSAPVPAAMRPDIGARTDVLYHVLRYAKQLMRRTDVEALVRARVGCVVSVHPARKTRVRHFARLAGDRIQLVAPPDFRLQLARRLGTVPNTGITALAHLLTSQLAELSVYGFDFYRTGHWPGQRGGAETAEQAAAQAGIVTGHDQPTQRAFVAQLLAADPRLRVTQAMREALEG